MKSTDFSDFAENENFDAVAASLRHRLYSNGFRCLSSFLYALAKDTGAHEAGVVSVSNRGTFLRRNAGPDPDFDRIKNELDAALGDEMSERKPTKYSRSIWILSLNESLVLQRIWPDPSWQRSPRESHWLYIRNPKLFVAPKQAATKELTVHLGALASAFIRWKNEIFTRHDELLQNSTNEPQHVTEDFRGVIVRPVLPVHFHYILSHFNPGRGENESLVDFSRRWMGGIKKLFSFCVRGRECRCIGNELCGNGFECPQTPELDHILMILAGLELWRTEFWTVANAAQFGTSLGHLEPSAIVGLVDAGIALASQDAELKLPTAFSEGATPPSEEHPTGGERVLCRHFCASAIRACVVKAANGQRWKEPDAQPSEFTLAAKLASLASTLLGNGRWTPEAIENILETVALYGHRVLDIPERVDLVRHLKQTLRGESALHTLKSRYRDHFFHTLEVCFLGFALLKSRPNPESPQTFGGWLLEKCAEYRKDKEDAPPLPKDEDDLMAQWWLAALVHDTAYGIDIYSGTLELLEFFTNRSEIRAFIDAAKKAVGETAKGVEEVAAELAGDSSIGKKGDHGVIAASSLVSILKKIGPSTTERFRPAVRAIAFHNTRFPKVDAGLDPVAALLILCDTVQEWGRSSLGFDRSPAVLLSRMMEASLTPHEEQFGPVKRYGLSLSPTDGTPGDYHWKEKAKFTIELDYGPEALKDCKAKFAWADITYNLQRVDFAAWDVDVKLQVSVPFPKKSGEDQPPKNIRSQFEHFGAFVEEQQVRFVERWFATAAKGRDDLAVSHSIQKRDIFSKTWTKAEAPDPEARELITFNLVKLGEAFKDEKPMMGGTVGDFSKAIEKWSGFIREQADAAPAQRPPV
jgi:hypothetical protein